MEKYIRTRPERIKQAPSHRFINYIHHFDLETPKTQKDYLENVQGVFKLTGKAWSKKEEKIALEALDWLVEQGLIKMVKSQNE